MFQLWKQLKRSQLGANRHRFIVIHRFVVLTDGNMGEGEGEGGGEGGWGVQGCFFFPHGIDMF